MLLLAAAALLVRCASAIPAANHAIPGAALMTLEKFADHGEPDALCMDGSSSGIYFAFRPCDDAARPLRLVPAGRRVVQRRGQLQAALWNPLQ